MSQNTILKSKVFKAVMTLSLLLIIKKSPMTNAQEMRSQEFLKTSLEYVIALSNVTEHGASFLVDCAAEVVEKNGFGFCYDVTTTTCYVTDVAGTPEAAVDVPLSSSCYVNWCSANDGFALYNDRCLKAMTTSRDYLSAKDDCGLEGAHLYYIKSQADIDVVPVIMADNGYPQSFGVWLGGDNMASGFFWNDGTEVPTGQGSSWLWYGANPDGDPALEWCLEMRSHLGLNDMYCTKRQMSVCQIDG